MKNKPKPPKEPSQQKIPKGKETKPKQHILELYQKSKIKFDHAYKLLAK